MSTRYSVQAVDRTSSGHKGCWRAGRFWPSSQAVKVEVLDQDDCPTVTYPAKTPGEAPTTVPHPTQIGRVAWAQIMADGRLSKTNLDVEASGRVLVDPEELSRMRGELALKDREIGELQAKLTDAEQLLALSQDENTALLARLKEAEAKAGRGRGADKARAKSVEAKPEVSSVATAGMPAFQASDE